MKTFSQVEGILYSHFEKVKNIQKYQSSLDKTKARINIIKIDLRSCNIDINIDIAGTDYSKDMITGSLDNTSAMEKALIREETKLEKELEDENKYMYAIKRKIRNLQKQIDNVEVILEMLDTEQNKIIYLLYKDKLSYRAAGYIMHCDHKTISNNKRVLVKKLMNMF